MEFGEITIFLSGFPRWEEFELGGKLLSDPEKSGKVAHEHRGLAVQAKGSVYANDNSGSV